jgi:hypothetical protein
MTMIHYEKVPLFYFARLGPSPEQSVMSVCILTYSTLSVFFCALHNFYFTGNSKKLQKITAPVRLELTTFR